MIAMGKRVLVIEDDAELGAQIVARLQAAGYETTWWQEGRRLLGRAPEADLVVLDLMLPGLYGMDLLKELRACSEVPVLMLSARNTTPDKVRALTLGADDYLTKPFWPEELLARVDARLRRPVLQRSEVFTIGALRIDRGAREVQSAGERVELTRVEFDLLLVLAERPGAAVTRRWLVEHALPEGREASERTLDVHVSRLRKKLGEAGALIETVWGVGYRLARAAQ